MHTNGSGVYRILCTRYTVRSRQPHSTVGEGNCRCHDSCHYTSHLAPQLPRQMQHFPPKVSHQPAAIAHTSGQSRCGTVSHADGKRECNGVCELERKPLSPKCRCTIYGPMSDSDTDRKPPLCYRCSERQQSRTAAAITGLHNSRLGIAHAVLSHQSLIYTTRTGRCCCPPSGQASSHRALTRRRCSLEQRPTVLASPS